MSNKQENRQTVESLHKRLIDLENEFHAFKDSLISSQKPVQYDTVQNFEIQPNRVEEVK